jgi:hypothetical protein
MSKEDKAVRYLIVPPCILRVKPKPKLYFLYSRRARLKWLKTKRRFFIENLFHGDIEVMANKFIDRPV